MADYSTLIGIERPGCLVDSTLWNINGAGVCADPITLMGKILHVKEIVDGYAMLSADFSDGGKPFAVSVGEFNSCDCLRGIDEGSPISALTMGKAWVLSEDIYPAPDYGDPVYVSPDGLAMLSDGVIADGWIFSGDFMRYDNQFYIVGVIVPA